MPRLYLLDTNILSHLVRQPQGPVADHLADVGEANVLTSIIVACELRYGAAKRGSRKLMRQVEAVLSAMNHQTPRIGYRTHLCVDSCGPREERHAHWREYSHTPIAAHARAIDAVCVTDNVAEFQTGACFED